MNSGTPRLSCTVVADDPQVAVLAAAGVLDLQTAPLLRAAILKCLAQQPDAVIVDLDDLTVGDDRAATVFAATARHAAAWPGIPVLLCAASPPVAAVLHRLGLDRRQPLCRDRAAALVQARSRRPPPQVRQLFPATPAALAEIRHHVVDSCHAWQLSTLAPLAAQIVSELATNAIRYAGGASIEVITTKQPRHLCIGVRDASHHRPRRTGPSGDSDTRGRGLLLLDALCQEWDYTPTADGKVTWATLPLNPPRPTV